MDKIGFVAGEKYENEKGLYEVISVDHENGTMVIRWGNGEETSTSVDLQRRILERRLQSGRAPAPKRNVRPARQWQTRDLEMPQFTTISPTHIKGKKRECWRWFRDGGYIALGWFNEVSQDFDFTKDLSGYTGSDIINLALEVYTDKNMRAMQKYNPDWDYDDKEPYKVIDAFEKFFSLEIGDYVAVNNTNDGLFGIGIIKSDYKFEKEKHFTGSHLTLEKWYPHYRDVEWVVTHYLKRKDIIMNSDTGWQPYGTIGKVFHQLPPYIKRIVQH